MKTPILFRVADKEWFNRTLMCNFQKIYTCNLLKNCIIDIFLVPDYSFGYKFTIVIGNFNQIENLTTFG